MCDASRTIWPRREPRPRSKAMTQSLGFASRVSDELRALTQYENPNNVVL
jgi:hypothetical protein